MKEKILNNLSLKLLSAVCAVVIWAVIVNVYDPNTSTTITSVTVQLINGDSLTNQGYTYEVVDGSKISVYISGPKSVVAEIKASDIIATADLSKVSAFADYVDIDVKVERDGRAVSGVTVTPRTSAIKLNIENRVRMSFDIVPETTGTPADGYVVTGSSTSPDAIIVTGSTSNVGKIASAKAIFDVTGINANTTGTADITLYDTDGKEIDNSTVQLSNSKVDFTATVANAKKIDIIASPSGKPAEGYNIQSVDISEQQVYVAGDSDILSKLSNITIPSTALNVEGLTEDKTFRFWLSDYAPVGVTVVSDNMITVTVKISNQMSNIVTVPTSQITILGTEVGLSASFASKSVNINVTGDQTILQGLSAADISVSVDLSGLMAGDHIVKATVTTNKTGISISGDTTLTVTLKNETTEPTQTVQTNQ